MREARRIFPYGGHLGGDPTLYSVIAVTPVAMHWLAYRAAATPSWCAENTRCITSTWALSYVTIRT
eukprot:5013434-Pyramimonas_sp.AAC.1